MKGQSNFLFFLMAGILIATMWGTTVILNDLNEEWDGPQPDIEYRTAYLGQNNTLTTTMENRGEAANFSRFQLHYRINGQTYTEQQLREEMPERSTNHTCFNGNIDWKNSVTYNCQTSIQFPEAQERVTLIVSYADGEMKWRHVCQPQTSNSVGC